MPSFATLDRALHRRLVDSLYVEAMVMADEARSYFDAGVELETGMSDPVTKVAFSCESLKVTTRLMHVIAWLLTQRAWQRGEIGDEALHDPRYQLGRAQPTGAEAIADFPFSARSLVEGSQDLYDRVARLQDRILAPARVDWAPAHSPARELIDRLSTAF